MELKCTLQYSNPHVIRQIAVPEKITLQQLYRVICVCADMDTLGVDTLFFKDGVQLKKTQQVDEIMLSESVPDSEKMLSCIVKKNDKVCWEWRIELVSKENRLSEIASEYEEILDTLSEEEKEEDFVNEDSWVFAEVKKSIKSDSFEAETKDKLKAVLELNTEEKDLKASIKRDSALLEEKTKDTIEGLSDEEVIELLKDKWIKPLIDNLMQLPNTIVSKLVAKIEALAKKYETTFAEVENQIEETEQSLSSMINDLEGSEFDMLGLAELKKLLGGSAK